MGIKTQISDKECIRRMIQLLGADVCGFASIDRFVDAPKGFSPFDIDKECKSVISFGIALPKGLLEIDPRIVYSHFNGPIICEKVDQIAFEASKAIEEEFNTNAVPIPCDAPNEYWEPETLTAKGIISMKHTAVLCGLGQLGKSTLLLNPVYGNRLTVGAILTRLPLESDEMSESICIEGCNKCMSACPVQAIGESHVNQQLCRPNTYGKTARGFDTVECNRCRSLCPMRNGKNSSEN